MRIPEDMAFDMKYDGASDPGLVPKLFNRCFTPMACHFETLG